MNSLSQFIASSNLTKLLAIVFLFLVLIASLAIAVYDTFVNIPINPYVTAILGAGLGAAINVLGIHQGAVTASGATGPLPQLPQQGGPHQ